MSTEQMIAALRQAENTFRAYSTHHAAKPDPVKAQRNHDLAEQMRAAIESGPLNGQLILDGFDVLTPLQQLVANHYIGGEFAYITTPEQSKRVGDGLFSFCIAEAGDAADAEELAGMLRRAIDQLRSLHDDLDT